jgi:phosphohistidine swiveling domain-containing protein
LRSSSPLEDRPGSTGAGLLRSESAAAVPEEIAAALLAVLDSADRPAVRSLMPAATSSTTIPLAILAQPHLELSAWLSAEFSSVDAAILVEGWHHRADPDRAPRPQSFELLLRGAGPDDVASGDDPEFDREGLLRILDRCRAHAGRGWWLAELGATGGEWIVLQLRPAPRRPAPRRIETGSISEGACGLELEGLGWIHAADRADHWVWDVEHCPTPLCPLLAGVFGSWLLRRPASWPSRLIEGRWHDRVTEAQTRSQLRPQELEPEIRAEFTDWMRKRPVALQDQLEELDRRRDALAQARSLEGAHERWHDFIRGWMEFQELYFDGRSSRLRRWVADVERELRHTPPSQELPPLPATEASRRNAQWQELADALRADQTRPAAHADAIAQWMDDHRNEPLAGRILRSLAESGHLTALPYDGRSAILQEDPLLLWRELARRMDRPEGSATAAATEAAGHRRRPSDDGRPMPSSLLRSAQLASRILARCEDDNELLLRAYAQLRRAVRAAGEHLARYVDGITDPLSVLDLVPRDLDRLFTRPDSESFTRALRRGRALARHWESWNPTDRGAERAERRSGRGASPGRAQGRPRRLRAALESGGPEPGEILVVPTIVPTDALVFSRLGGLVCEGGDVLGHASVLAREHGIPAVVGIRGARSWLADATQILVDGDRGRVSVLRRAEIPPAGPHLDERGR